MPAITYATANVCDPLPGETRIDAFNAPVKLSGPSSEPGKFSFAASFTTFAPCRTALRIILF